MLFFISLLEIFQEEFRKRRLALDNALREEVQREAALLARVEKEKEAKCELARRSDKQDQRQMYGIHDFPQFGKFSTSGFSIFVLIRTLSSLPFHTMFSVHIEMENVKMRPRIFVCLPG